MLIDSLLPLGQGYQKGNLQRGVLKMTGDKNMENAGERSIEHDISFLYT